MVCEFLPPDFKKKLVEIATIDDLMNAGYSKMGAYKAKEKGVMSDEKCERLVEILGYEARGVLIEALKQFVLQLNCAPILLTTLEWGCKWYVPPAKLQGKIS